METIVEVAPVVISNWWVVGSGLFIALCMIAITGQ